MTLALIAGVILFLYPFVLYPGLLKLWRVRRRTVPEPGELPRVGLVICALNEERVIGDKLTNSFTLDYQRDRLSVYLVNDGSTDRTGEIAGEFVAQGLRLISRPQRMGKVSNLNEVVPKLAEEIVVLSDANVIYHRQALRRLVARFDDPLIGGVSGRVVLTGTAEPLRSAEENYYSIEWLLQERASDIYSMCGADGAMYAFRRYLFRPCPPDTIIEDFVIPMSIVRQGYRVVFESGATAMEQGPASLQEEFQRKVRIAAGAAQALIRGSGWPGNAPFRFWFVFVSHKLLRWLSPLVAVAIAVLAGLDCPHPLAVLILAGMGGVAMLAAVRVLIGGPRLLDAPFYFLFSQVAAAAGLAKGLLRKQSVLWEKTNR